MSNGSGVSDIFTATDTVTSDSGNPNDPNSITYSPPADSVTAGVATAAENIGGDISYTNLTNEVQGLTYDGSLTVADVKAGDYSAAFQNGVFDAQKIVGTVLNNVGRAQSVIASFNAATSSKDAPDYVGDKTAMLAWGAGLGIVAGLLVNPLAGAAVAAAWDGLVNAVGVAHAGPGRCNPGMTGWNGLPASSNWDSMRAWPGYESWSAPGGAGGGHGYGPFPLGSFEAWANDKLEYNRALFDNCFANYYQPPPLLLAQLIAAWNATHYPAAVNYYVSRDLWNGYLGANSVPTKAQWDPIADALTQAQPKWPAPGSNPDGSWPGGMGGFWINMGPLHPLPQPFTPAVTAAATALFGALAKIFPGQTLAQITPQVPALKANGVAPSLWATLDARRTAADDRLGDQRDAVARA